MNKPIKVLLAFLIFPLLVNAQSLSVDIAKKFDYLKEQLDLKFASISLTVLEANTGKVVFQHDGDKVLSPASTLKLITSTVALETLGPDFKFNTKLYYTGNIVNKTLVGNIVIIGDGDPTLGSFRWDFTESEKVLKNIITQIKLLGIEKIDGHIITNVSNWNSQNIPNGWIWQDLGNYYGAGTSPICWRENAVNISFNHSKIGQQTFIADSISYPFIHLNNHVTTGLNGSGDDVYAYFEPNQNSIILRGTYGIDHKKAVSIAIPNPALALAFDIYSKLKSNNIEVKGYQTSNSSSELNDDKNLFYTLQSPPLSEIIFYLNQKSINLYAEQILRKLGDNESAINSGISSIKKYLSENNFNKKSLFLYDGSGLSPQNKINTNSLAYLLHLNKQKPWFNIFYKSLPEINNMKMKSGTIANVLAYAGYQSFKGKWYCFSIILNNYNGEVRATRQKLFEVLNVLKD